METCQFYEFSSSRLINVEKLSSPNNLKETLQSLGKQSNFPIVEGSLQYCKNPIDHSRRCYIKIDTTLRQNFKPSHELISEEYINNKERPISYDRKIRLDFL